MSGVILNRKAVKKNRELKNTWKASKKAYGKLKGKYLKKKIGKVVRLTDEELLLEEQTRITTFCNENNLPKIQELIDKIRNINLEGMSGNGFPVAEKLESFASRSHPYSILLVNAVECEPGILHDEWLVNHRLQEILTGCNYLQQIFSIDRVILASKQVVETGDDIHCEQVPNCFPMGEEYFLIDQVLGKHLNRNELPIEQGVLVMNAQTVYQIVKIINHCYDGGRFVTLANLYSGAARIAYVEDSTKIQKVLEQCFGKVNLGETEYFAGGGILNAHKVAEDEAFSTKICFAAIGMKSNITNDNKCRKCGACTRNCPMGIDVRKIVKALEENPNADITMYHPENCIQCGSCTWFCRVSKDVTSYCEPYAGKRI